MLHSYFVPLLSASMFNLPAESTEKPFLAQWFCCAGRDRTDFPEPGELGESFGAGIWQLLCCPAVAAGHCWSCSAAGTAPGTTQGSRSTAHTGSSISHGLGDGFCCPACPCARVCSALSAGREGMVLGSQLELLGWAGTCRA